MESIRPLAKSVADELRASLVINSLEQCASELVQNSLDAGATTVEVKVDVANHSLHVSDNGRGISSADIARVGTRYATSKCSTIEDLRHITTYGFRGEAVAAIAEMSLVDIVSRPKAQDEVYSTIFKGGDRLYCGPSKKHPRYTYGTTISVRDLFYKFPVRQRYWSDASPSKLETELEKVKRAVETLAMTQPDVTFKVSDMAKNTTILVCRKAESQLHRIRSLLGQALSSSLVVVKSSEDDRFKILGFISTVGHYNRLHQSIFLNGRPVLCDNFLTAIALLFQQSSFAKDGIQQDADVRRSREKHPVFVLLLTCQATEYDICADPAKVMVQFENGDLIMRILRNTIISFLERQQFLSRTAASHLREQQPRAQGKRRRTLDRHLIQSTGSFEELSHVKTSRPSRTGRQKPSETDRQTTPLEDTIAWDDELEFELDRDWMGSMLDDDFEAEEVVYSRTTTPSEIDSASESWRTVRTRASLPHETAPKSTTFKTATSRIWAQDALRKWVNPVFPTAPSHIPALQLLSLDGSSTDSSVGRSMEDRISRFFGGGGSDRDVIDTKNLVLSKSNLGNAKAVSQLDAKFILCTMEAASKVPGRILTVLAVIDQHAADERVRVERLMKEICSCSRTGVATGPASHHVDSMPMIPPLPITLTRREWHLGQTFTEHLLRWGFALKRDPVSGGSQGSDTLSSDDDDPVLVSHHFSREGNGPKREPLIRKTFESDYVQGLVTALPRIVADRCVVDSVLTQDLIKDTISWVEESRFSQRTGGDGLHDSQGASWLCCVRGCPRGILDIVNSKACRGAIMFNDVLTLAECERVIQELAQCTFPFQCAHGRPSVFPLAVLDDRAAVEQVEEAVLLRIRKKRDVDWQKWMRP